MMIVECVDIEKPRILKTEIIMKLSIGFRELVNTMN